MELKKPPYALDALEPHMSKVSFASAALTLCAGMIELRGGSRRHAAAAYGDPLNLPDCHGSRSSICFKHLCVSTRLSKL